MDFGKVSCGLPDVHNLGKLIAKGKSAKSKLREAKTLSNFDLQYVVHLIKLKVR